MNNIVVVDALPGSGKTEWAIAHMNKYGALSTTNLSPVKYLYITPFWTEVERAVKSCSRIQMVCPDRAQSHKVRDVHDFSILGKNIAATHSMLEYMVEDDMDEIKYHKYALIIDETIDTVQQYAHLNEGSVKLLLDTNAIKIADDGQLKWIGNKNYWPGKSNDFGRQIIQDIKNGKVYKVRDKFFLWQFPVQFLNAFEHVTIMTYMFKGSLMEAYLTMHGITPEVHTVVGTYATGFNLAPLKMANDMEKKRQFQIAQHVNTRLDAALTPPPRVGRPKQPLSNGWFTDAIRERPKLLEQLKNAVFNFQQNIARVPQHEFMWTCKKSSERFNKYQDDGFIQHLKHPRLNKETFVSMGTKATNDYAHKSACAYVANRFVYNPYRDFFRDRGIEVRDDTFALTEMVQWIWRSRIRKSEPIHLFLPSKRMRAVFKDWLTTSDYAIKQGKILGEGVL